MFFLTVLAMAATATPGVPVARMSDCKPMLSLASQDQRDANDSSREMTQRRTDPRPRPQKRCITLASA